MRAVFGVVSLLIVLAVIGGLAVKQMRASSQALGAAAVSAAPPAANGTSAPALTGNVRQQSQQLQQRVRDDVARAVEQGAASRKAEADK